MSSQPADPGRSPQQATSERAMLEVSDVLLNLDHALARAKRARKVVAKDGDIDRNAALALDDVITELTSLRKRFMQDTYLAGDSVRLL